MFTIYAISNWIYLFEHAYIILNDTITGCKIYLKLVDIPADLPDDIHADVVKLYVIQYNICYGNICATIYSDEVRKITTRLEAAINKHADKIVKIPRYNLCLQPDSDELLYA